jgi:exodeoxyribonuclease VII small subunit
VKAAAQSSVPSPSAIEDFERSLSELETLVSRMEQGSLSLDDMVKSFERGMSAYRQCQQALDEAQLKVDVLLREGGALSKVPFDPETP